MGTHLALQQKTDKYRAMLFRFFRRITDVRNLSWLVLILSALILFWNVADAPLTTSDEARYAAHARNAIANGQYLYAVDENGHFSTQLTKPPLVQWLIIASFKLLGFSLLALRLPFALSALLIALLANLWGRRIQGPGFAFIWALLSLFSAASLYMAYKSSIEVVYVLWIFAALWAYDSAVSSETRWRGLSWSLAAAIFLVLAFLTKQIMFAVGLAAIFSFEILRRRRFKDSFPQLIIVTTISVSAALLWFWLVYDDVGEIVIKRFIYFSLFDRLNGLKGTTHFRTLNRSTEQLTKYLWPYSWPLAFLGLALLLREQMNKVGDSLRLAPGSLLLGIWVGGLILLYGNLSRSMLPWYMYAFVPALSAGLAWLLYQFILYLAHGAGALTGAQENLDRLSPTAQALAVVAGLILFFQSSLRAAQVLWSQFNIAVILLFVLALLAYALRKNLRYLRQITSLVLLLSFAFLVLAGLSRLPNFRRNPDRFAKIMQMLNAEHFAHIYVNKKCKLDRLKQITLFGPKSTVVQKAPWKNKKQDKKNSVYINTQTLPLEYKPPAGVRLIRGPGASAFLGQLNQPIWDLTTCRSLLDQGSLTYEAEQLAATNNWTLGDAKAASGGMLRAIVPWLNSLEKKQTLSFGPRHIFPAGKYRAKVFMRGDCHGYNYSIAELRVEAKGKRIKTQHVSCKQLEGKHFRPVMLDFTLKNAAELNIGLDYKRGRLWHDKTVISRKK